MTKDAPLNKPIEFTTSQTFGSFGMFNLFNSLAGNYKKISYYSFLQYRYIDGYRRTDKFPGPGIIPFVGRSAYVGVSAKF